MTNNDIRKYINVITEGQVNNNEQLDEAGGLLDKPLAALGSRAAKGRMALKQYYKDLLGDWREYAAEIGLDKSQLFSQNNFPTNEFVDFLKSQQGFDNDMVTAVKGLGNRGRADVKQVMQSAAEIYAKKNRGVALKKGEEELKATGADNAKQAAQAMAGDTASGSDIDQAATYFKSIGGDLDRAVEAGQKVVGDPARVKKLDHLQRVGLAYLAARGKLKLKK